MPGTLVAIGLNGAADLGRGVGLGVERLVLRRAALEPEEDDVLRLAEGGALEIDGDASGRGGGGFCCSAHEEFGSERPMATESAEARPTRAG